MSDKKFKFDPYTGKPMKNNDSDDINRQQATRTQPQYKKTSKAYWIIGGVVLAILLVLLGYKSFGKVSSPVGGTRAVSTATVDVKKLPSTDSMKDMAKQLFTLRDHVSVTEFENKYDVSSEFDDQLPHGQYGSTILDQAVADATANDELSDDESPEDYLDNKGRDTIDPDVYGKGKTYFLYNEDQPAPAGLTVSLDYSSLKPHHAQYLIKSDTDDYTYIFTMDGFTIKSAKKLNLNNASPF